MMVDTDELKADVEAHGEHLNELIRVTTRQRRAISEALDELESIRSGDSE